MVARSLGQREISAHRNLRQQVATVLRLIKRTSRAIFNLQSWLFPRGWLLSSSHMNDVSLYLLLGLSSLLLLFPISDLQTEYRINKVERSFHFVHTKCPLACGCFGPKEGEKITNFWYNPARRRQHVRNQAQIDIKSFLNISASIQIRFSGSLVSENMPRRMSPHERTNTLMVIMRLPRGRRQVLLKVFIFRAHFLCHATKSWLYLPGTTSGMLSSLHQKWKFSHFCRSASKNGQTTGERQKTFIHQLHIGETTRLRVETMSQNGSCRAWKGEFINFLKLIFALPLIDLSLVNCVRHRFRTNWCRSPELKFSMGKNSFRNHTKLGRRKLFSLHWLMISH